ncbi:hypothetical protein WMY93_004231 [Mugilogobius chulae]|uniref:Bcr-Abl oncoprotein oligomerisation domain-containing protein n=1 Tax=Mugilogobius chulae TaxID=88201 RepID=A0AAW0Q2X2_9GOBI
MVEPVGFVDAWRAQFPESDPPSMDLNSMGEIEHELDKCKSSIKHLEKEVNKERFRMIYLQTLLAKEKKSYDGQRWGFKPVVQNENEMDGGQERKMNKPPTRCKSHPRGDLARVSPVRQDTEAPDIPTGPGSVAAIRSNFERIRRANTHTGGDSRGLTAVGGSEKPFYVNMEYHHEKGLVKVNDKDVSDKISTLGSQAMQMERKRSLSSKDRSNTCVQRGGSTEENFEEMNLQSQKGSPSTKPTDCQPYTTVYVGGMMPENVPTLLGVLKKVTRRLQLQREPDFQRGGLLFGTVQPRVSQSHHGVPHVSLPDKSRSPSQNSQQSFESSSPPTPLSQKRLKQQQQQGQVLVVSSGGRKAGSVWPSDGESTTSSRTSHDTSLQGDLAPSETVAAPRPPDPVFSVCVSAFAPSE